MDSQQDGANPTQQQWNVSVTATCAALVLCLLNQYSVIPSGIFTAGAAVTFLAAVSVTTYITASDGVLQFFVKAAIQLVPGTASIPIDHIISALRALYVFMTFGATGAAREAGQAMARKEGLDSNRTPSRHVYSGGFPCLVNVK